MLREECRDVQAGRQIRLLTQHKSDRNITRVAVAARVGRDVFVPQDQQGDVLALQLAVHAGPSGSSMRRWPRLLRRLA